MNLRSIRRRLAAICVAGAALTALVPAPAHATTVCNATNVVTGPATMLVLLEVHATEPNASAMYVGCGIVQNGRTVAYVDAIGAPAAANADVFTISPQPYSICRVWDIQYRDGTRARFDGCP
jgi:hypothetical protein